MLAVYVYLSDPFLSVRSCVWGLCMMELRGRLVLLSNTLIRECCQVFKRLLSVFFQAGVSKPATCSGLREQRPLQLLHWSAGDVITSFAYYWTYYCSLIGPDWSRGLYPRHQWRHHLICILLELLLLVDWTRLVTWTVSRVWILPSTWLFCIICDSISLSRTVIGLGWSRGTFRLLSRVCHLYCRPLIG